MLTESIGKIKVGILGATGYVGAELIRLLLGHPEVAISAVSSVSFQGENISDIYPNLYQRLDMVLCSEDEVISRSQVVFGSMPHGLSEEPARKCLEKGVLYIDMGADFRLERESDFRKWYDKNFSHPELHGLAVYGLPELFRDGIKRAQLIANPGCYPTSVSLGLAPALKNKLIEPTGIIVDAKSGATGAGRGLTQKTHYPECNEAFSPYSVAVHRHTPEIEQTLSGLCGQKATVTFVPHLLPVSRGIISTMYAKRTASCSLGLVHDMYTEAYKNEPFVRVIPQNQTVNIRRVAYSNYCDISIHEDAHTGLLIVASAIDNMIKGAAGQAIQNMNLRLRIEETTGLMAVPAAF